jgi:hypothetical protein
MVKVNIFNRAITIILMIWLIVFSIVIMMHVFMGLFDLSALLDKILKYFTDLNPYILAAILFLVLVISLIILIFEFYRVKIKISNITSNQPEKTMVSLRTVSRLLTEKIIGIEGIVDPNVSIMPMRKGIIINTSSKLIKGVNVAEKIKEIRNIASEFASGYLGFKVIKSNYTVVGFISSEIHILNKFFGKKNEFETSIVGKESKNMTEETETRMSLAKYK